MTKNPHPGVFGSPLGSVLWFRECLNWATPFEVGPSTTLGRIDVPQSVAGFGLEWLSFRSAWWVPLFLCTTICQILVKSFVLFSLLASVGHDFFRFCDFLAPAPLVSFDMFDVQRLLWRIILVKHIIWIVCYNWENAASYHHPGRWPGAAKQTAPKSSAGVTFNQYW